jgi:hypothetical protein
MAAAFRGTGSVIEPVVCVALPFGSADSVRVATEPSSARPRALGDFERPPFFAARIAMKVRRFDRRWKLYGATRESRAVFC